MKMSSSQKQIFMTKKTIASLPAPERERRWKQHLASKGKQVKPTPKKKNREWKPKEPTQSFSKKTISDCSLYYTLAMANPWACPEQPCIPDNLSAESFKFAVRVRGTFQIGTSGVGFVALNPYNPYIYSAGNTVCGFLTDSTFAGSTYAFGVPGVGPITSDASQPYTNATTYDQAFRVVGAGIQACYQGTEINRSGSFVLHRDPSNSPIVNGTTASQMLQSRETVQVPMDRQFHCCLYKPVTPSDLAYAPRGIDIESAGSNIFYQNPTMVIMVVGATPGQSFLFDTIIHFEMTGRSLPALTKSHVDPIGYAAVSSAVSNHQPLSTPMQNAVAFAQSVDSNLQQFSFIDGIASVAKQIIPIVQQAASVIGPLLV